MSLGCRGFGFTLCGVVAGSLVFASFFSVFLPDLFGLRQAQAQDSSETAGDALRQKFSEYANQCLTELSGKNPIAFPKRFQCIDGPILPISQKGVPIPADTPADSKYFTDKTACDKPPILDISRGGIGQCVPNSRLQVRQVEQQDVDQKDWPYYALLCRNYKYRSLAEEKIKPEYDDIAMIVYSPANKKTCFFQRLSDPNLTAFTVSGSAFAPQQAIPGTDIPSPFEAGADAFWDKPSVVEQINCAQCHDANPYVRTPYAYQVTINKTDSLPRRSSGEAYEIVALDHFGASWKQYHGYFDIQPRKTGEEGACVTCHSLGLGNSSGSFTDYSAGKLAPNQLDTGEFDNTHWMPPRARPTSWSKNYDSSVKKLQACNATPDAKGCNKKMLH